MTVPLQGGVGSEAAPAQPHAGSKAPVVAPVVDLRAKSQVVEEGVTLGESTLEPGSAPLTKAQVRLPQSLLACSFSFTSR